MSSIVTDKSSANMSNRALGTTHQRLFYLHDLPDYKVHHDDTDIRGWTIKLDDGQSVGTVENLIVDKTAMKVRYVEVTSDRNFHQQYRDENHRYLDQDRSNNNQKDLDEHFLVPIGMVSLDHNTRTCHISGMTPAGIGGVPRYRRGSQLQPSYEVNTLNYYNDQDHPHKNSYDRSAYRDFNDKDYRGMSDSFYTSGYFNSDSYYDRHDEASRSKGL